MDYEKSIEEIRAVNDEEERKRTEGEIKMTVRLLEGRRGWTYIVIDPERTRYKSLNWYDSAFAAICGATTTIQQIEAEVF